MGSGGDGSDIDRDSTRGDLFAYRYWQPWSTAKNWPEGSVVLARWLSESPSPVRWQYHLIDYLKPDGAQVVFQAEYILIETSCH